MMPTVLVQYGAAGSGGMSQKRFETKEGKLHLPTVCMYTKLDNVELNGVVPLVDAEGFTYSTFPHNATVHVSGEPLPGCPQCLPAAAAAGGSTSSGVAAGQSLRGTTDAWLLEAFFPSTLYCFIFTLYDGADVAMRLASHAMANGFRGEVRHVSTSHSDFELLIKTNEASLQTLMRFASWLGEEVPVRAPAMETAAFAKAAKEAAARVEVTSDLSNPPTNDRKLLDLYNRGQLTVIAATEVRLALEEAARVVEQGERLSDSSLGKSRASSSLE